MRLAARPSVLRYVLFAAAVTAVAATTRCDTRPEIRRDEADEVCLRLPAPATIHFKIREHYSRALGIGEQPLFAAAHGDARDDWMTLDVLSSKVDEELARLANNPAVEEAFVVPEISLPRMPVVPHGDDDEGPSCPITTPSYEHYQGYIGPAPQGIDAPSMWGHDIRGKGVWFADVEGGWNDKHEDLPGDRITHAGGQRIDDPMWRAHGTAVLGEVVGRDNGKGVVGIAPDTERVFTSSIGGTDVANALDAAAEQLRPGDVMLIELQGVGPRGRYLPVEFWDDCYDAIKAATDRGVVVIEAAGNGAENLDLAAYKGKFDRWKRDSGAIMIGAGGPARDGFEDRARLDFSNYGSRVDVQGWGRKVATLDYGDLQRCDDADGDRRYADRHYTDEFSGTSSASPIVAGAAVLLESYAKQEGEPIKPIMLRELLRRTGSPQTGDLRTPIGPRPNLAKAVEALEQSPKLRALILDE